MSGRKPERSPLHPKALTLSELQTQTRGTTVVVCTYRAGPPRELERMDAAGFLGVVNLWVGLQQPHRGSFVVIDPVPGSLRHVRRQRLGLTTVGVDVDSGNLPQLRGLYKVTRGYAFSSRDLGLLPLQGRSRWAYRCVIKPEDM